MPNYKEMYYTLLRAQRDAILILQEAHQKAEELYLSPVMSEHLYLIHPEPAEEKDIDEGLDEKK